MDNEIFEIFFTIFEILDFIQYILLLKSGVLKNVIFLRGY